MSASVRSIFSQAGFFPFLITRLCGVFAMQIQAIVVAWQVYDVTHQPMALAFVGLAQFIPMLFCVPFAGDIADRFSRKKVLAVALLLFIFCSLSLMVLSWYRDQYIYLYYVVLVIFGCARSFMNPSLQSILPQIVSHENLAQSLATNSTLMKAAVIVGPALGGFMYAKLGGSFTYFMCAVFLTIACIAVYFIKTPYKRMGKRDESQSNSPIAIFKRFGYGARFIWSNPVILGSISLDLFAVLLGGVVALLPIYAKDILMIDSTGVGVLRSSMAVGEITAGLILSRFPLNKGLGATMFGAVAVYGVCNLVFSLSTHFWLSFLALAIAGFCDMVSVYIRSSLVQFATPDYLRGRVSAVNMLFIGSSNELGEFRTGVSTHFLGPVAAGVFGSLCTLGVVAFMAHKFKMLFKIHTFEEATAKEIPNP